MVSFDEARPLPSLDDRYDAVIAGAGLAGVCSALVLSRTRRVLVIDPDGPAAGASGAAAGLINPFMGRRVRPTWRLEEALEAAEALVGEAGAGAHYRQSGVLRPARDEKQLRFMREAHEAYPDLTERLTAADVATRYPAVRAPHGALYVRAGGSLDVASFARAALLAVHERDGDLAMGSRVADWKESDAIIEVAIERGDRSRRIRTDLLVLCLGPSYSSFPALEQLGLRGVKGQTVRLLHPDASLAELPTLSGHGYVAVESASSSGTTLVAGSTYEHDFTDLSPTPDQTRYILEKTARMLPEVEAATVVEAQAGVRVMPSGSHLPLVGPLLGHEQCWTLTALGSRGLLTAPLIAQELPRYLDDPVCIPEPLRID